MSADQEPVSAIPVTGPKILYLSKYFGYPLGGVRIAHHHVALLRRNGFDARILLVDKARDSFFEQDGVVFEPVPRGSRASADDIFVVPEPWHNHIRDLTRVGLRTLVFCQNHFNVFHGLRDATSYLDLGVEEVFACSRVIAAFLEREMGLPPVSVIRNGVDHARFRPGEKRLQIAYMPRKMANEADFIRGLFRLRHPEFRDVPWVSIVGVPEAEVAEIMAHSAVFLALGRNEGFGLPPVEAMAGGCLVVGFVADGGREFATERNGIWCPAEDYAAVADGLARALRLHGTREGTAMVGNARQTAARFGLDAMEEDLVAFWSARIGGGR